MIFAEKAVEEELSVAEEFLEAGRTADAFEGYSIPHSARIAEMADALAVRFRFAPHDRLTLKQAAFFLDAGELAMGREYISVPRPLTAAERADLHRHPVIGEQQAAKLEYPRAVQLLVRWHHEWWNGSGYPDRLEGAGIPLAARILRVCDTYSALTSDRPFRRAFSVEEADRYLAEAAGIEFDPSVALELLSVPSRFYSSAAQASPFEEDSLAGAEDEAV
jgi:HD-GYP domain-containing protein (c-di-GMP phosphodiesterase class II)